MRKWEIRTLSAALTLSLLSSTLPTAFAANSDIDGHWAHDAMEQFAGDGYLQGDGKRNYLPDRVVTRAEFATLINHVMALSAESDQIAKYTDVKAADWYYGQLSKALAKGYLQGTTDKTLSPLSPITRQQAFVMLARILELNTESADLSVLNAFSDADDLDDWAKASVAAMVKAGYITGNGGKLQPTATMSRAEGVTLLNRTKAKLQETSGTTAYKDGVYIGTGAGYGGTMKVQVTVFGGKITDIKILSEFETAGYLNRAKKLIDTLLAKQSTEGG